ncbi:hypothetical protein SNEBB_005789 [Seison nebaliae]|nr:hypothetical protein SNEBB_005789 [Seison nebaliae]
MERTRKIHMVKTRQGQIIKVIRECYLRDDIPLGLPYIPDDGDDDKNNKKKGKEKLDENPNKNISNEIIQPHYLMMNTDVLQQQLDVIEDEKINNIIITQTSLIELKKKHIDSYRRICEMVKNNKKKSFIFINEFNKFTYTNKLESETVDQRNFRSVMNSAKYYAEKLDAFEIEIILLTNDEELSKTANYLFGKIENLRSMTIRSYVEGLIDNESIKMKLPLKEENDGDVDMSDNKDGNKGENRNINRTNPFRQHLSFLEGRKGIAEGKYSFGKLTISSYNYLEGTVLPMQMKKHSGNEERKEILIKGLIDLNRSFHDDLVVIDLLPKDQWKSKSNVMKLRKEISNDDIDEKREIEDDDEKEEDEIGDGDKQPTGRVVAILKRGWRPFCGLILPSKIANGNRHLFVPTDKRIPFVRIESRQRKIWEGKRVMVALDSWPPESRFPLGHIVRVLGDIGDTETETEIQLLEHDVPFYQFSEEVLKCLPSMPWNLEKEIDEYRKDLRHLSICSVDPPGCTDIDDALHCRKITEEIFECGVHIADVSHFIRPQTPIDKEAAKRGNTVYLIDRRIDMVPELLSSNLCSLRDDGDRFAFSIIWQMNMTTGEIISTTFCKSIIRSRASLTYQMAQSMIDDQSKIDELTESLRKLNLVAKILRNDRLKKGALLLASPDVRFDLDSETNDPVSVKAKQMLETNGMVEEFMLLANISAAKKIYEVFPQSACLRRHPIPPQSNFDHLISVARSKNIHLDTTSNLTLSKSLENVERETSKDFSMMLKIMTTRCMTRAAYFSSGLLPESDFTHYGLASDIYTHFTSPIRRYADVMVHRLLSSALHVDRIDERLLDKNVVQQICNNLNYRHKMAEEVSRASIGIYTKAYFRDRLEKLDAFIMYVRKNGIQIMMPKYGIEMPFFFTGHITQYNETDNTLKVKDLVFRAFDRLVVQVSVSETKFKYESVKIDLITPSLL